MCAFANAPLRRAAPAAAALLLAAAAAGEPVGYRLAFPGGRVAIESTRGEIVPWASYSLGPDVSLEDWQQKHDAFVRAGVHLYQLTLWQVGGQMFDHPFFSPDGEPLAEPLQPATWPEMAERLLGLDPEARFFMRFSLHPTPEWRRDHLDQYQPLGAGKGPMRDGFSFIPSLASEVYRQRSERLIEDAVAWCERQPWRDRIVGYMVVTLGEGATEAALFDEHFDASPVMQQAYRTFLRRRYGDDAGLRAAWDDAEVSLATVSVPTRAGWLAKREALGLLHWPEPAAVRPERDYYLLQKELFHRYWTAVFDAMVRATAGRPVIKSYDTMKQHMQGWLHDRDFDAAWRPGLLDTYNAILLASGSIGVAPLLDHPGLDLLQTPGMYYNRAMGYAWEAEGLSDSLLLRGKANYAEADLRTWVRRTWRGAPMKEDQLIVDAGVFMTPAEMEAGFDRTLAWALTRNQMFYWASVCGANWWFHEPPIEAVVARQRRQIEAAVRLPWAPDAGAICLVVDDEAALYEDFSGGFQYLAVYRQIEEGLALCGVPYRIHLLSDLAREDFPDYRCFLFPNLFRVDAGIERLLREKVLRDGRVAIFGPATGITDGETLSAEGAARLLGVPMELVPRSTGRRVMLQDHGHPISRRLPAMTYGDTHAYGPLLVPAAQRLEGGASGPTALGACFYHYFFDRPGPFVKEFGRGAAGSGVSGPRGEGDYAVVFSPAVPLPPELLRECARHAGAHVWSEDNAVVYAGGPLVAVHRAAAGPAELRLPGRRDAWDLRDGTPAGQGTDALALDDPPPFTRMFLIGPPGREAESE